MGIQLSMEVRARQSERKVLEEELEQGTRGAGFEVKSILATGWNKCGKDERTFSFYSQVSR